MFSRFRQYDVAECEGVVMLIQKYVPSLDAALKHVAMVNVAHNATDAQVEQQQWNGAVGKLLHRYHVP